MIDSQSYSQSHRSPEHASSYTRTYATGYYATLWRTVERRLLLSALSARTFPDEPTLDVACGQGRICGAAAELGGFYAGVDVSLPMLRSAVASATGVGFLQGDAGMLPFRDGTFGAATLFRFLLNAEESLRNATLAEIRRVVRPGGVLVANVHVTTTSPLGIAYAIRNTLKGRHLANTLSVSRAQAMLMAHGFATIQLLPYGFLPRLGPWHPTMYDWALSQVERLIPHRETLLAPLAQCVMIVATRS